MASSSSSSSFTNRWKYEVFLSFHGKDTRLGFTGNLHRALCEKEIKSFINDQDLEKGAEISPTLKDAIQSSRIALVILSKNYASSTFCLDELGEIMDCSKDKDMLVLPIFYEVEPSDVRYQKENYADALNKHEAKIIKKEKIEKWRVALTKISHLSGWHFKRDMYEYKLIEIIVQDIIKKIQSWRDGEKNKTICNVNDNYVPQHDQRVNVYRWNDDGKWEYQGTGHVNVYNVEARQCLFVCGEKDNKSILWYCISSNDIYRKQEDTIIRWRDPEYAIELALSFHEPSGCSYTWDHICNVQRNMQFNTFNNDPEVPHFNQHVIFKERVEVYCWNDDGKWEYQGTGHVSVDYFERSEELGLFIYGEENNETILLHRITSDNIYRRLEDKYISWRDPEYAIDLALTFQEPSGFSNIWDQICGVQRKMQFNNFNRGNYAP